MSLIDPRDKMRFKESHYMSDWLVFTPSAKYIDRDLSLLNKYKHLKIAVTILLKGEYSPDGFNADDIDTIKKFSQFRGLRICSHFLDISYLETLTQLEYLRIGGLVNHDLSTNAHIDLDLTKLTKLEFLTLPILRHKKETYKFENCVSLKYLFLPSLNVDDSLSLKSIRHLKNLKILSMHRVKLKSLEGIGALSGLEYLEIDYTKNLADISDLSKCSSLIGLEFQNCPNLKNVSVLGELKKFRILQLWNCQNIESLKCLNHSDIEYLNFYSSNIRDGDLSFLDNLPSSKTLRFQNKRHYNRKSKEFDAIPLTSTFGSQAWDYYKGKFT